MCGRQLRQKRAIDELAAKMRIAEESREVAQTAFQALAVTEKMTADAFSLERILKIGVISLFGLALVIVAIFFLFSRRADKETRRAYTVVAQLERNAKTEEQLLESAESCAKILPTRMSCSRKQLFNSRRRHCARKWRSPMPVTWPSCAAN